jgi:alpha-galactosidase
VNVPNAGLVDNLSTNGVVEVAATVDRDGIAPQPFGALPEHLAAIDRSHIAFHDLVATSVIERDREAAVHALMVDPLTSAVCSLSEIRAMFDEMAAAQQQYLPAYIAG